MLTPTSSLDRLAESILRSSQPHRAVQRYLRGQPEREQFLLYLALSRAALRTSSPVQVLLYARQAAALRDHATNEESQELSEALPKYKNVFVLCTGRCGSMTFAKSCEFLSNYTASHESLSGEPFETRFNYPDNHIEVDNRLSWFLGSLPNYFNPQETFYVHLLRNENDVAVSHYRRWDSKFKSSIIRAFAYGISKKKKDWTEEEKMKVCISYVRTVNSNIQDFMHQVEGMIVHIENPDTFDEFLTAIEAKGDLNKAKQEFRKVHNQSKSGHDG